MEHVNILNINPEVIRENIDNSIIEQLLSDLINKTIISLQSKELNINISDIALSEIIKRDKNFFCENETIFKSKI